jgi:hypothetical protein
VGQTYRAERVKNIALRTLIADIRGILIAKAA